MKRIVVFGSALVGLVLSAPSALAQKAPDVRLNDLSPPGEWSAFEPKIASSGSTVYVAWEDTRDGGGGQSSPRDVHFDRSLDGGATWLSSEIRLDTRLPAGQNYATSISMAASGDSVYVAFADTPGGYGLGYDEGIYLNRSLDEGTTWLSTEVRVDHPPQSYCGGISPVVAASGSNVYVAWLDSRSGLANCSGSRTDLYFNRSLNGGQTWVPFDLRLDFPKPQLSVVSSSPALAASGSAVYAVWLEPRTGPFDVSFNRSLDNGTNWLPASVRLDSGNTTSDAPQIAAAGSTVCAVWTEHGPNNTSNVHFNRSLDGGTTWLPAPVPLGPGLASGLRPSLALVGSTVYVAWEGDVSAAARDVYFNRSLDAGTTWLPAAVRIDTGPAGSRSREPALAADGSTVFVAWSDDRHGSVRDVYCNRSIDSGTTWLAADVRLDVGSQPGVAVSANQQVAASGSSVYVVWEDERNGGSYSSDIYFNLALGHQNYGSGTPGTGGNVPMLSSSGKAAIGGAVSIDVTSGRGGAPCWIVFGFNGSAEIPSRYGTLLLQPPWVSRAIVLGGAAGVAGAGSASVVGLVPNDPTLVGTRLDVQAGLLDPAAMAGVALSNGVEVWIL
jgi:hypothetical protein